MPYSLKEPLGEDGSDNELTVQRTNVVFITFQLPLYSNFEEGKYRSLQKVRHFKFRNNTR